MKMSRRKAVQLIAGTGAAMCLPKGFGQTAPAASAATGPATAPALPPAPAAIAAPAGFGVADSEVFEDFGEEFVGSFQRSASARDDEAAGEHAHEAAFLHLLLDHRGDLLHAALDDLAEDAALERAGDGLADLENVDRVLIGG